MSTRDILMEVGLMKHAKKAVEYYNNNINCSQGVFTAFATEMGIDEKYSLFDFKN